MSLFAGIYSIDKQVEIDGKCKAIIRENISRSDDLVEIYSDERFFLAKVDIGADESEVSTLIRSLNAGFTIENDESNMFQLLRDIYEKFMQGDIQGIDHPDIHKCAVSYMVAEIKRLLTNNELVAK